MAASPLLCWTRVTKGNSGNEAPSISRHQIGIRGREYVVGVQNQGKSIRSSDVNGLSSQEYLDGIWSRRKGLLLIASLPTIFLQNGFPLFRLDNKFKVHALEVEGAEIEMIRMELRKVLSKGKAAGLLRLVFHDAGTFDMAKNSGGMNGSIIYELDRPENKGLNHSVKVLEKAKTVLDMTMQVSWADLIAVAGAEAVAICGGPSINVRLGRQDTLSSDADGGLPAETLDASDLKECFQRKGFSTQELVALSGAHTLGSKGFGNPTTFDNSYFHILLQKPWIKASNEMSLMIGLPSDRALVEDEECFRWITTYANDQGKFFDDFADAYIKLVNSGAHWTTI